MKYFKVLAIWKHVFLVPEELLSVHFLTGVEKISDTVMGGMVALTKDEIEALETVRNCPDVWTL